MKVLIADFDIYHQVGGGQTFYQRLIETNPNLDFYYLVKQEKINHHRPANAQIIPYQQLYLQADLKGIKCDLALDKISRPFLLATNIAYSLKNQSFDCIDYPDYEQYGLFLAPALIYYQVKFEKIILSLHGTVSQSLREDWYVDHNYINNLEFAENLQYQIADIRYGISQEYLEKWQKNIALPNYYFHPFNFLQLNFESKFNADREKPSLNFIGRKEKRKGVDIFVNLVSFLPDYLYSSANIIGSNPDTLDGKTGEDYLQSMLDLRLSSIKVLPSVTRTELQKIFATNSLTFLPSRIDSLNLVALESLFSGCPTIIGNQAGVCRFLEDNFPQLPWLKLDVNNFYHSIPDIIELLNNYPDYRLHLQNSLAQSPIEFLPQGLQLVDIYAQTSQFNPEIRTKSQQWYQQLITHCQRKSYWGKIQLTTTAKKIIQPTVNYGKNQINQLLTKLKSRQEIWQNQFIKSWFLTQELERILLLPEHTATEIDNKLNCLVNLGHPLQPSPTAKINKLKTGYFLNRLKIWQEIARLEKIRGNLFLGASYEIRIIRLLGEDRFNQLDSLTQILTQANFPEEAHVLNLLYQSSPNQSHLCREYLINHYQKHLHYQPKPFQFIDDYREPKNYRIAVIVSLYNASDKLEFFLTILAQQTLCQKKEVEIILIDSGSPQAEYQVFQQLLPQLDLPIVYARSEKRETIQSAWNRGIALSQSAYITCLGVDEIIVPWGLEILAQELDKDRNLDWVVGHSLVTEVDSHGNWIKDVMLYNRSNFAQDLVYLDTCYLTYVGGLYRRDIHHRFGYYDETFRGAGDTEFKNRILSQINCRLVNQVLGVFCNYPSARTTQSPLAEIEDLRAWYLYRTVGGVEYFCQNQDLSRVENLLLHCLNYRKSFLTNPSTDFALAMSIIAFLEKNYSDSPLLNFAEGVKKISEYYCKIELNEKRKNFAFLLLKLQQMSNYFEKKHKQIALNIGLNNLNFTYQIFNDNRFQQHFYLW